MGGDINSLEIMLEDYKEFMTESIFDADEKKRTALHWACYMNFRLCVYILVTYKPSLRDKKDYWDQTPDDVFKMHPNGNIDDVMAEFEGYQKK